MNYYELLNITKEASAADIKRAYFAAVKQHTPDSDPEGFKQIRAAYETLFDEKKRKDYDARFIEGIDRHIQNELLHARGLLDQNEFRQAADYLSNLREQNPDQPPIDRLYAEALWRMKKSGTADNICQDLLDKNPNDYEAMLLRAQISASRGHVQKAGGYFNDAIAIEPNNPKAWSVYFILAEQNNYLDQLPAQIFEKALEVSLDMFKDEYILYLWGIRELNHLYREHHLLRICYSKFAEFFAADTEHSHITFINTLNLLPDLIEPDDIHTINFLETILPTLESGRHRHTDQKGGKFTNDEKFCILHGWLAQGKLRDDDRIHDVIADLTAILMNQEPDADERLGMECYIVSQLPDIRQSLKDLRTHYPQYYTLHQAFYDNCLNPKSLKSLQSKYSGIHKKLISKAAREDPDLIEIAKELEQLLPFIREAPKTGRNDPCPCGSGKKYKRCCG